MGQDQFGEEVVATLDIMVSWCKQCRAPVEIWDNGEVYHADPVEADWHGPETGCIGRDGPSRLTTEDLYADSGSKKDGQDKGH